MIRLTISLPKAVHQHVAMLAIENNVSLSKIVNQLVMIGINHWNFKPENNQLDQHCQQLIIQMNVLIKNLAVEILKFNQNDFDQLRQVSLVKFYELRKNDN